MHINTYIHTHIYTYIHTPVGLDGHYVHQSGHTYSSLSQECLLHQETLTWKKLEAKVNLREVTSEVPGITCLHLCCGASPGRGTGFITYRLPADMHFLRR